MKISQTVLSTALGLWLASMAAADKALATPGNSQDPYSASNVDSFSPTHLELNYFVDFDTSTTFGTVTHHITALDDDVSTVIMDVWDNVEVSSVEFWTASDGGWALGDNLLVNNLFKIKKPEEVAFEIIAQNNNTGNALGVNVPAMVAGTEFYLRLSFRSLPASRAFKWLAANATAGKSRPFVYSLCEMIYARDWMPLFDTPGSKITYNATVTAPNEYTVQMSGNETSAIPYNDTWTSRTFESSLKMPTYQLSLIAGELESVDLGTDGRIKVFAEPPLIHDAAKQFKDFPAFLKLSEEYLTPYQWGTSYFFVMPDGYAMGGMEHINAIQLTNDMVHDSSMMNIAIHEITHSWFGNDVGCNNWDHFWINEGINTFAERKIVGKFYGKDSEKEAYYFAGTFAETNDTTLTLFPNLGDEDPFQMMASVQLQYDKGARFMYHIQSLIGEEKMQAMLRAYIHRFSQQAIDQTDFKEWYHGWILDNFDGIEARDIIVDTKWDAWIYDTVDPVVHDYKTPALKDAEALATEYMELNATASPQNFLDFLGYTENQQRMFVRTLATLGAEWGITADLLEYIDNDLGISKDDSLSIFVKFGWFMVSLAADYTPGMFKSDGDCFFQVVLEDGTMAGCASNSSNETTVSATKSKKPVKSQKAVKNASHLLNSFWP